MVLAGPTASGKSGLALALAARGGGEIVCADSRQLYAGMRIGSAGPTDAECAAVPHHGFHVVDPDETYNAGRFVAETDTAVQAIQARGRVPILVGGAGLYLRAYRFGLDEVPRGDPGVRAALLDRVEAEGVHALYDELRAQDPVTAGAISRNDEVRVVRALEVLAQTGQAVGEMRSLDWERPPRVKAHWVLLEADMAWLDPRLLARAREMFRTGLVPEAQALRARLGPTHERLRTMGYEEALLFADGRLDEAAAIERAYRRQRRYAKRQRTWFKKEGWWTRLPADGATVDDVRAIVDAGL